MLHIGPRKSLWEVESGDILVVAGYGAAWELEVITPAQPFQYGVVKDVLTGVQFTYHGQADLIATCLSLD